MAFANPLPWWAFAVVVLAAACLAWLAYRQARVSTGRRTTLGGLRFITLMALVVLLMRPVARTGAGEDTGAVVPILVDTSRSMSIEDADGHRRIDAARSLIAANLLPSLNGRFSTEVLGFGNGVSPVPAEALTATEPRSDLTSALQQVSERYRGRTVAGIVLLSDGGDTSAGEQQRRVTTAPVFAIGLGSTTVGRDREVLSVTAAEAVLDQSRVDLTVSAVAHGHGTAPIELRLLENGRVVDVRRLSPAADGSPVSGTFHVSPAGGAASVYTVEIPSAAGELVPENNTRSVLVQPPARPRRVLLVQGAPGFEHSFLQRAWSGDTGLEVDSVVRKGKNEQGGDTFYVQAGAARGPSLAAGYPAGREQLFAYDAVVLANMEGATLGTVQLEATREFVAKRGGGLLVLGAQSFLRQGLADTPLEDVLPLDLSDRGRGVLQVSAGPARGANRVTLTAAGEAHPIMQLTGDLDDTRKRWEAVPALASISALGGPRPGASVLAVTSGPGGTPRALVAVQRYGSGRSMVFTGEAAWRWRMLLPAADRSYDTFWRQAVRWVAVQATDPVTLIPPASAVPGEVLSWRITARDKSFEPLRDAAVEVRVTAPDGRMESIAAVPEPGAPEGTYVARQRAGGAGIYRAVADVRGGAASALASSAVLVGGADAEMTDPRLNTRVLQRIAGASGGALLDAADLSSLPSRLQAGIPAAVIAARRDLWHNGWSFAVVLSLLAGEWVLRRRWGLR